jgi:hypothetical protein
MAELVAGRTSVDLALSWKPGRGLTWSTAATIIVTLIGLSVARWRWVEAHTRIIANLAPLADPIVVPPPLDESLARMDEADDDSEVLAGYLAEADSTRTGEGPRNGPDGTLIPKQTPYVRFGPDAEHGTGTPLDTRESKPIY